MADAEDWAPPFADLGDEEHIPLFGIRVLSYLGADGTPKIDWAWCGDQVQALHMAGVLDGVKMEIFHRHMHDEEDDGGAS